MTDAPGLPGTADHPSIDLAEVCRVRHGLIANGYQPLKVHAPWSPYVDPARAGKQPTTEMVGDQKISWRQGHSPSYLMRITSATANTGLVLGGTLNVAALDFDPPKAARATDQVAFVVAGLRRCFSGNRHLRQALIRTRDPASIVLLFRSDRPLHKLKVQGERGAVELLAEGQQVIVHGYHPLSRYGTPVRWNWRGDRAPWTVPAADLPIISAPDLIGLMQEIADSGLLGPLIARPATMTAVSVPGSPRSAAYPATDRLHELFEKHDGMVRPSVRELMRELGSQGTGRHDGLVAIAGRLVHQRWTDEQATNFLVPLTSEFFTDDEDWSRQIEQALEYARKREVERHQATRGAVWPR